MYLNLYPFPRKNPTQYNAIKQGESLFTLIKTYNKEKQIEEWKLTNVQTPLNETQLKEIAKLIQDLNKGNSITI